MVIKSICRQALLWALAAFLFLSILFLPRNYEIKPGPGHTMTADYHYSFQDHLSQFQKFYLYLKVNRGLGEIQAEGSSVTANIWRTFLLSMKIAVPAMIFGFFAGIVKGVFDYRVRNRKWNLLGAAATKVFLSVPDLFFIIGIQIAVMATFHYGLFPLIKVFGHEHLSTVLFCILFLSIYPLFYIATITYYSLHDEQGRDYIRTALAKGMTSFNVLYIHMLKNCLLKILSHTNTITLYVLSNLFIVEFLTSYKGAAYYFLKSVAPEGSPFAQGYPVSPYASAGYTLLFTLVIFASNTISQISRKLLFPFERGSSD